MGFRQSAHQRRKALSIVATSIRLAQRSEPKKNIPLPLHAFEVGPSEPATAQVIFVTRVWEPTHDVADREAINEQRATIVRMLRSELGSRFLGGIEPSAFATEHFGDCVTTLPTDQLSYLTTLHESAIAVSTRGLFKSNPHKLGEYLAASRAVVTERLHYDIPARIDAAPAAMTFNDPEQCVELCLQLLEDPARVQELRQQAWTYYNREVRPDAAMRRRLEDAAEKVR